MALAGTRYTTELESRLQPVAQAVEVRVRLRPDVQLATTHGSRKLGAQEIAQVRSQEQAVDTHAAQRDHIVRDRLREVEGGMRFFIPGFSRDDQHVILLGLRSRRGCMVSAVERAGQVRPRVGQGLATILFHRRAMEQTLNQAARAGRGELDTRLMESLGQDMEAALTARKEADRIA